MENVCSFFGHRNTEPTEELTNKIRETAEMLITEEGVSVFLFGSKSRFDSLCYKVITNLRNIYPDIRRVYVRSAFPMPTTYIQTALRAHISPNK